MPIEIVAEYQATDFSKHPGRVLDAAARGPVRVRRRGETYVLLRAGQLEEIIRNAGDPRPKTLDDMLAGYDATEIKARIGGWLADGRTGKEAI